MALNKAALIAEINSLLASGKPGGILASEHRSNLLNLVDKVYDENIDGVTLVGNVLTFSRNGGLGTPIVINLPSGATNLSYTASPTQGVVVSDTGNDATLPLSTGTNAGLMAPGQFTKLATVESRANHTGSQLASTISDFAATVRLTVLTGLNTATNAVITAADTLLVALGKLQRQITDVKSVADNALQPDVIIDEDDMVSDSDVHLPTQQSVKAYVDASVIAAGAGDMTKSVYDPDNNGVVNNSEALEGQTGSHYLSRANHAGTQLANTISNFAATVLATVLTGLSLATATAITAADTVLTALGKLQAQINNKQETLVSATNIKTVNGNSLLGSGNLVISGGGSPGGATTEVQFNNAGAFDGDPLFAWDDTNKRLGVGIAVPLHRLHVKGVGATVATFALKIENSAGINMMSITDALAGAILQLSSSDVKIQGQSGNYVHLQTNGLQGFGTEFSNSNSLNEFKFKHSTNFSFTLGKYVSGANGAAWFGWSITPPAVNLSAQVQIDSTTKGFLPPRMTTTEKNAIASPAAGLMVYDITLKKLCVFTTAWETITSI